jgi:hypothetical protein
MSRFAILTHDHPFPHWDLLIENDGSCRTWRLLNDPGLQANQISAEQLPDHRLMYLDYEGPVGGDRGTVNQWDHGEVEWRINCADVCEFDLTGSRWRGRFRLSQVDGTNWIGNWQDRNFIR